MRPEAYGHLSLASKYLGKLNSRRRRYWDTNLPDLCKAQKHIGLANRLEGSKIPMMKDRQKLKTLLDVIMLTGDPSVKYNKFGQLLCNNLILPVRLD